MVLPTPALCCYLVAYVINMYGAENRLQINELREMAAAASFMATQNGVFQRHGRYDKYIGRAISGCIQAPVFVTVLNQPTYLESN